ncbi:hypothetical protein J4E91_004844 [Alternaria rosae]|nr:hypothetical protein J4E91_004844 [Alternaria rosae]
MAEMSKHTPGQENQEKSRTRIIRIRERLSKAEEYISQLQKEEKSIEQNEKELREQWHDYMKDVSLGHDDAFIKAGILPDYTKDESKYVSGKIVSYDKSNEPSESRLLKEADIKSKLHAARKAYLKAEKVHENHRNQHEIVFGRLCARNPTKTNGELATTFPSIFVKRG